MSIISKVYYRLGPYVNQRERSVGQFFRRVSEHASREQTRQQLAQLIQQDLAVINLWTEYQYKGYHYLRRSERRKLYEHAALIANDFAAFYQQQDTPVNRDQLQLLGLHAAAKDDQLRLLTALTRYFSPQRGVYEYQASSSFGRLLRDPSKEKLVGDCNQIVTLYIYLYAQYFPISDLELRMLPGHVALHYKGVDIEATNGTFRSYAEEKGATIVPIEEIVSINLLDTSDAYLSTHEIAPEDFLQSSRLAALLSHDRTIVQQNLEAAYITVINQLMDHHNYTRALDIAKKSRNMELMALVGWNGAIHHMKQHQFSAARRFAEASPKKRELVEQSYQSEGHYHFAAGRYLEAIKAYESCGDQSRVRACYEALFFAEQKSLPKQLTTETIAAHASTIRHMQQYAKKSGNAQLIAHASGLVKYI